MRDVGTKSRFRWQNSDDFNNFSGINATESVETITKVRTVCG